MDFTIVTAVSADYLRKLRWSISTWTIKPQFKDKELIVFYTDIDEKDLSFVGLYFKKHRLIKWDLDVSTMREKILSAFIFGSKYITTDFYVKLDADVVFINKDNVFSDDDFNHDVVSHRWGYTKPGYWIQMLDNFYNKTDIPVDKKKIDRLDHPRIISFLCLHRTEFVRRIVDIIGDRLPVPSHDTTLWYYTEKLGNGKRMNIKAHGVEQKSTFKGIREAVCSQNISSNIFLSSEMFNNVQLEITTVCNLGCFNCDRNCGIAPSTDYMTVDQVATFVNESLKLKHEWKRIDIIGGEPTLHKDLFAILAIVKVYKDVYRDCVVRLSTNGYGDQVNSVIPKIPTWVVVRNSSKESKVNEFEAYNCAPIDKEEKTFNSCSIPWRCGIGLTKYGYFPCGAGASLCRVFGFDIGVKSLVDLTIERLHNQISRICRYCGHSNVPSKHIVTEKEISPSWEEALKSYKDKKLSIYG